MTLGFNDEDADRLYEDKDNWMGVSTGGRVLCAVKGCKFETPIASDQGLAFFECWKTGFCYNF